MIRNIIIVLVGLAVIAGGVFYFYFQKNADSLPQDPVSNADLKSEEFLPIVYENGGISVTVTPEIVSEDAYEWQFKVAFDTHSGDLDYDIKNIMHLGNNGDLYEPLEWRGDPPGGHHLGGLLIFKPIEPMPSTLRLVMNDAEGVLVYTFEWEL